VKWLRLLAALERVRCLVPAHYDAPVPLAAAELLTLAASLDSMELVSQNQGSWAFLAGIDNSLVAYGLVPPSGNSARNE
jgi:hypothetical protein